MRSTTLPVTAVPLSFSAWARPLDRTTNHHIVNVSDEATGWDGFALAAEGASAGDPASAIVAATNNYSVASSANPFRELGWAHLCAVFTSATSRDIYYNGLLLGSNTTSRTPAGLTAVNVGRFIAGATIVYGGLEIGPLAIYSAALQPAHIKALARGDDPRTVNRGALAAMWKMDAGSGDEIDVISGNVLTAVNSPGVVARPSGLWRLLEDRPARIYTFGQPAAVGSFIPSWAIAARGQIHGAGRGH